MKTKQDIQTVYVHSRKEWRRWLERQAGSAEAVKLVLGKGHRNPLPLLSYDEVIEEAICFGWIDHKSGRKDATSYYLFLAPRTPDSKWSLLNMYRAENMIRQGLMTSAGQICVDEAVNAGRWKEVAEFGGPEIPDDLQKHLEQNTVAFENFTAFVPSSKRIILEWIVSADEPETRQQRIDRVIELAGWR